MSPANRRRIYIYGSIFTVLAAIGLYSENPVLFSTSPEIKIDRADPAKLKSTINALTQIQPPRAFEHPESLEKAATYLEDALKKMGLPVRSQAYQVAGKTFRNLIVHLGPTDGEAVVIGAHYDACGDQPGADDNASGVAGLLELARLLADKKLKRPVELIAYTLEEPPNFFEPTMGSYIHAKSLIDQNAKVKLMISLEMIGYFSDQAWSQKYPIPFFYLLYPTTGDYIALLARPAEWSIMRDVKALFSGNTPLAYKSANVPEFVPGLTLSDHANYWHFGYPAMMITDTAFMRNVEYHKTGDTPDRLNYEKMAEVVNGVAAIAIGL